MRSSKWILVALCFVLSPLFASAATPDTDRMWTTVGSAGTLDEKSQGQVFFDHGVVQMGSPLVVGGAARQPRSEGDGGFDQTESAVIRYNVTAVDGLFDQENLAMTVRFLAEGRGARVVAQLISVDILSGAESTLLTLDSDDPNIPVKSGYHAEEVLNCKGRGEPFDFMRKAYYVEATLTTSSIAVGSAAGIEVIQINATTCIKF